MLPQSSLFNYRGHNRKGWGASEEEQLKVGPEGARKSNEVRKTVEGSPQGVAKRNQPGASESKNTEGHFKQKQKISTAFRVFCQTEISHFLLRDLRVLRGKFPSNRFPPSNLRTSSRDSTTGSRVVRFARNA